jgi:hypothetical protein
MVFLAENAPLAASSLLRRRFGGGGKEEPVGLEMLHNHLERSSHARQTRVAP